MHGDILARNITEDSWYQKLRSRTVQDVAQEFEVTVDHFALCLGHGWSPHVIRVSRVWPRMKRNSENQQDNRTKDHEQGISPAACLWIAKICRRIQDVTTRDHNRKQLRRVLFMPYPAARRYARPMAFAGLLQKIDAQGKV